MIFVKILDFLENICYNLSSLIKHAVNFKSSYKNISFCYNFPKIYLVDGSIDRYKTGLVSEGFTVLIGLTTRRHLLLLQRWIYSSVTVSMLKLELGYATTRSEEWLQKNGELEKEVFMDSAFWSGKSWATTRSERLVYLSPYLIICKFGSFWIKLQNSVYKRCFR